MKPFWGRKKKEKLSKNRNRLVVKNDQSLYKPCIGIGSLIVTKRTVPAGFYTNRFWLIARSGV